MNYASICNDCRDNTNGNTPCFVTTTPKRTHLYNLTKNGFECIYRTPKITPIESLYAEIYQTCNMARDGMSGAMNFSVLLDVAKSRGVEDFDDLLFYANEVENLLHEKRAKKQ